MSQHSESIVSFEDPSGFSPSGFQPSKPINFSPNFRALEEPSRPVSSFLWNSKHFVFIVQVRFVSSRLSNPLEFEVRSSSLESRPDSFEVESTEWEGSQLAGAPIYEWDGGSEFTETLKNGEWEGGSQFPPPPSHPPPSAPSLDDFYPHVESFDSPPPAEVYPPQSEVYLTQTEIYPPSQFGNVHSHLSEVDPPPPHYPPSAAEERIEASNEYQFQYLSPPMLEERIDIGNEDYSEDQSPQDLDQLAWIVQANPQNYIFNPQVCSCILHIG